MSDTTFTHIEDSKHNPLSYDIYIVEDSDSASEFIDWCKEIVLLGSDGGVHSSIEFPITIDTETEGLLEYWWPREPGSHKKFCRVFSIACNRECYVVPVEDFYKIAQDGLKILFEEGHSRHFIFHNCFFDMTVLLISLGIDFREVMWRGHTLHDTYVLYKLLVLGKYASLDDITTAMWPQFNDVRYKKTIKDLAKEHGVPIAEAWAKIHLYLDEYLEYAGMDAIFTLCIWYTLWDKLEGETLELYDDNMIYQWVMFSSSCRGLRVDSEFAHLLEEEYLIRAAELVERIGFNINSPKQIIEHIGPYLPENYTKSGQLKTDKNALANCDRPLAKDIIEARRLKHYAGTYFKVFATPDPKGFIHPEIHVLKAVTGRDSISNPPMHQIPKDIKEPRQCVIAREGHKLVSVDYRQQEFMFVAHYSGSETMIDQITEGIDFHTVVANALGIPRQAQGSTLNAKTFNYALIYGASTKTVASNFGIPVWEAEELIRHFDALFPDIRALMSKLQSDARDLIRLGRIPYVVTEYGRRIALGNKTGHSHGWELHTALNYLCQGTGNDMVKVAIRHMMVYGLEQYVLIPVHDEILFEFPEEDAEDYSIIASNCMQELQLFRVPILTDISEPSDRWEK